MTRPTNQADPNRPEVIRLRRPGTTHRRQRRWSLLRRLLAFRGLEAVVAILLWKAMTFGVIYVAWAIFPFNTALYDANLRYGPASPTDFRAAFTTWDSQHFLRIADFGYQEGLLTNAFGPLYPMLIRATGWLTGDLVIAGLIVANLASGAALYLLYDLVRRRWNREVAFTALLLAMAFPTAFYLNLIYTEALFLLLLVTLFHALYLRHFAVAALAAFLLPLLRLPGLVGVIPLAWVLLTDAFRGRTLQFWRFTLPRSFAFQWSPRLLYLLAPLAGFAAYLGYMHVELGNAFVAMETEKMYISDRGLHNLLHPDRLFTDFFRGDLYAHGYLNSELDRAFFVAFLISLPVVYRVVDKPMFIFCAIIGLQPFLGSFMSYTRLVLVAFPLYIAYAGLLGGRRQRLALVLVVPMAVLQGLLLSMHVTANWVA